MNVLRSFLGGDGRRARPRRRGERGAAAVEFAIVLPLLFVLLFGIIEFGILFYNYQVITNASREGARAGIIQSPRLTVAQIQTIATNYCGTHLVTFAAVNPSPTVTVSAKHAGSDIADLTTAVTGDDLTVLVTYPYTFLVFPNLAKLLSADGTSPFPGVLTLSAQSVMKYE